MARPVFAERALARAVRLMAASTVLAMSPAFGLESLDESALAEVSGQDGLTVDVSNAGSIGMGQLNWMTDRGAAPMGSCTGGTANQQACTLTSLQATGDGAPLRVTSSLDVFGGPGGPGVALMTDWDPMLVASNRLTLNTPTRDHSASSIGSVGMYTTGHLHLVNQGGLFNSAGNTARLDFSTVGDIILRQGAVGSPELSFGNFELSTRFSTGVAGGQAAGTGTLGIDSEGLVIRAPYTDTRLQFDVMFNDSPATAFDRNNRQGILRFGWLGGLVNPSMRIRSGGVGYGSYSTAGQNLLNPGTSYAFQNDTGRPGNPRSEGINFLAEWDFDTDFQLAIGQASGSNETQARFGQWRRMAGVPASTPMLSMPVTLDVVQNGTGPQGLCFGGGFSSGTPTQSACGSAGGTWIAGGVPAGQAALAALIRDGHLHAYSQQIEVDDPNATNASYRWGLVHTMGKMDADFFFYPEGRNDGVAVSTGTTGLKADITLAIQSPGYWDKANSADLLTRAAADANWSTNSHFMVANTAVGGDTSKQYGIGLMNADLLWSVRGLYFRMVDSDSGYPLIPGGFWLQTDQAARFQFRGLFGGGNLLNLDDPVGVALLDVNLATNRFIFALHPEGLINNDAPIGFSGLLDLNGTSYLSIAEKGNPANAYRIGNMSGRIGWRNGRVTLASAANSTDGKPSLTISNELLFGTSANFGTTGTEANVDHGGAPVVATVGFGTEGFGRIALPAGTWRSDISIKIPTN